jgi:hypothetical protein
VASDEAESCALQCEIDGEGYSISISCEEGRFSDYLDESTEFTYNDQGLRSGLILHLNRERTYATSKNKYQISGTIAVDLLAKTATYTVSVTGGVYGDTPQVCQSPGLSAAATATPADAPTLVPTRTPRPTRTPTPTATPIAVDGIIQGTTYLSKTGEAVPGVEVHLYQSDPDAPLSTMTSDDQGHYQFTAPPGQYNLYTILPLEEGIEPPCARDSFTWFYYGDDTGEMLVPQFYSRPREMFLVFGFSVEVQAGQTTTKDLKLDCGSPPTP